MVISSIPEMKIDDESVDPVDLSIYSSGLLDWEDEQALMLSLKSDARVAVSHWIQEKRYVVRLLVSAFIFLAAYFVFSLAVRDPIPMIDEFLIGIALAAVYWIYAKKKDEKAQIAIVKRESLYKAIEETNCTYSDLLSDMEAKYDEFLKLEIVDMADRIANGRIEKLDVHEDDQALFNDFKVIFHKQLAREEKHLSAALDDVLRKNRRGDKFRSHLIHAYSTGSFDIYLLALAIAIYA